MCRGPHEWSTEELEDNIGDIKEILDEGRLSPEIRHFWEGRLEMMEELLKEKAEKGII